MMFFDHKFLGIDRTVLPTYPISTSQQNVLLYFKVGRSNQLILLAEIEQKTID